ncbi:endo-1,4-beta-xylanase [Microbacterium sp. SMR1]|uniref:endo-1,4-beta-xylanase n=1 Tax=Microbacterium sp. SMR1 TaxID=1497340 RepID=UPI000DCDB4A3|nr:endo-1,4-beta-xylanase [Microbacterium sp. SMR1]RAZ33006.1 hypothetical protein DO944_07425 [Microbacterium sp. SMR1]
MRIRRPRLLAAAATAALAAPLLVATGAAAAPGATTPLVANDFSSPTLGDALTQSGGDGSTLDYVDGALVVRDRDADYVGIQTAPGILEPETEYTVSARVRLAAGTPDTQARWVGVPGYTWIGNTTITAGDWTTVTGTWTSPQTTEDVRLYLGTGDIAGTAAYTYLVDDVTVTATDGDPGANPGTGPDAPGTVLIESTFDDGALGAWQPRAGSSGAGPTVEVVPGGADESSHAALVTDRTHEGDGILLDVTDTLLAGQTYAFSAALRFAPGADPGQGLTVSMRTDDGGTVAYTNLLQAESASATGWTTVAGDITIPGYDAAAELYIEARYNSGNTSPFLVDQVRVAVPEAGQGDLDLTPLKDTTDFPVGVAIDQRETSGAASDLLRHHFDQITPENHMKVEAWYDDQQRFQRHPQATALLDYAAANDLRLYGHVLLWHAQTPDWFFQDASGRELTDSEADKQLLRDRLATHIDDVARSIADDYGLFGSETNPLVAWDVVNEVISDQATPDGLRTSRWHDVLGEEFIHLAFRLADQAFNRDYAAPGSDRPVKLFINDYNTEQDAKGTQYEALVGRMVAAGTPLDGVGHQFHVSINTPVSALASTLDRFAGLGLMQAVTELDVTVNPATAANLARQGYYYRDAFEVFRGYHAGAPASEGLYSVTVWGLTDARSWRSEQAPLLFAGDLSAKSAFFGAIGQDDSLPPLVTTADVFRGDVGLDGAIADAAEWRNLPEHPLTGDAGGFQTRWSDNHLTVLVRSNVRPERIEFTYRDEQAAFGTGGDLAGRTVEADGAFYSVVQLPHEAPAVGATAAFDVRVFGADGLVGSWNSAGATGQLTFYEELSYLEIPRADTITVDAVVDDAWADAPRIETAKRVEGDATGATATVRTLWRDNVLYTLFEVVDPEIDTSNSDPWNRDGVEIFLDLGNTKSGAYGPNDTQIRITVDGDVTFGTGNEALQRSRLLESATARTANGYIVEAAIDLVGQSGGQSDVPLGGAGTFQGFDAQVNDARGGSRFAVHTWAEPTGTGYQTTSRWGVLHLVESLTTPGEPGGPGEPGEPDAWATVDIGDGRVAQGGSLPVRVSGLEPQQQIGATLYSDPIVVSGIPAADASGEVRFAVAIPRDLPTGEHTLVITSPGFDDIRVAVTVVSGASSGSGAAGGTASGSGSLSATGGELPWGAALAAAVLLTAGGLFLALRRRRTP